LSSPPIAAASGSASLSIMTGLRQKTIPIASPSAKQVPVIFALPGLNFFIDAVRRPDYPIKTLRNT